LIPPGGGKHVAAELVFDEAKLLEPQAFRFRYTPAALPQSLQAP
jgi:hypothetical protein